MFVDINDKEISEEEVTLLFDYEDFLKASVLNGHSGKQALKRLKNDIYKKYMLYQPQIRTTYKVFK